MKRFLLLSLLLATKAWSHDVAANECPFFAYGAAFIAQDHNRGLTKREATERHLLSLKECMEQDGCTAKDGEDVQRILSFIDQVYAIPADTKIDPKRVYVEVMQGCLQEERARHMPKGIKERGPQLDS